MSDHDDDLRHLGEPVCGKCGSDLLHGGGQPEQTDIIECSNKKCGRKATYAEVSADCQAVYAEFSEWYLQKSRVGIRPGLKDIRRWRPKGKRKFTMKVVAIGKVDELMRDFRAVEI
ncbi:hypothetical protein KX729_29325 [Rhizobium sp. XQZ8]|uniref:hypothetical protein n=1 Tax=Rhizobium populisoli TaxID=2859785 RepID=UPI001CA48A18|nr:hypothetical protein [Rhizobium populisoli]MBW6425519.1 hypothetical protein [Rhizobium populisoli]